MEFISAFEEIDVDSSGEITRGELVRYMKLKNYKPAFVEKWLTVFDADHSGTITLDEFCTTLGLVPNQSYKKRIEKRKSEKVLLTFEQNCEIKEKDLRIIDEDPDNSDELRTFALQQCRYAVENYRDYMDIAKYLKEKLDVTFDHSWNVVVDEKAYGCFLSHEPGAFIHIKAGIYAILLWKVPAED